VVLNQATHGLSEPAETREAFGRTAGGSARWLSRSGIIVVVLTLVIAVFWFIRPLRPGLTPVESESPERVNPTPSGGSTSPTALVGTYEFGVVQVDATGAVKEQRKGRAQYFIEDRNGVALVMVEIPGGQFLMGSPTSERDRFDDEGPQHTVRLPAYYMGKTEVTQAQWRVVASLPKIKKELNPTPSYFKGDDLPVEQVSWEDAMEFCDRLSQATGKPYRLPSEAEWEYACRAGTKTPFSFGVTITPGLVNYDGNYPYGAAPKGLYRQQTTPVGELGIANAFGLFDLHGNVWEWCLDAWHKNYAGAPIDGRVWEGGDARFRVLRGGSWYRNGYFCRAANRGRLAPDLSLNLNGFRVVLSAQPQ
jgi:eukaryotic-like serine/threonine-protein kinase